MTLVSVDLTLNANNLCCVRGLDSQSDWVEMEAIMGATVAAIAVYDMCKAVSKEMVIGDVKLLEKSGGTRGDYVRD